METFTENEFSQNTELQKRKQKVVNFLKKPQIWVLGFLLIALVLGIYIRSLPMTDHPAGSGIPGLWDITTNNWTLGPDLDPWLFLRNAKEVIETGTIQKVDMMRNVPLGFDNSRETLLLPYLIDYTYHISKIFYSGTTPEFAGALFPVIMFGLTIISFFLFVREIFIRRTSKSKTKANIISLIATFFMIVVPAFLSRTIAGIPEKESAAFFFMFLALYFFLKAWKQEKLKQTIIFGILAGITTALMGIIWGGVMFVYLPIAISIFFAFILNKIQNREYILYSIWVIISIVMSFLFIRKSSLIVMLTSITTGFIILIWIILTAHFLIWKTNLSKTATKIEHKTKLPKTVISLLIALILVLVFATIFLGPSFVIDKLKAVHQMTFHPTTGRWNTTVAENRQPYFTEWGYSFGPFIKNIPVMFMLFLIGAIILFKKTLSKIKQKDAWILTSLFTLLLLGMIFSRYSGASAFNGANFISKLFYYGSVILFFGFLIKKYLEYHKENNKQFEEIEYEYLLLLTLFTLGIFSARGAVRLIMVLAPIASIFVGYLIYESINQFIKSNNENKKIFYGGIAILIIVLSLFTFYNFYQESKVQAYNMIPSYYNQQWQKAMEWVRTETPKNAVFGHWWDYGYWVQSIGERATVLDGGNAISFWNYWMGRLVLTGDNQSDALEFLYNHNTTHLLIDSSDIEKYGAYSSIGSEGNGNDCNAIGSDCDRYSWMQVFFMDVKQTQETNNLTYYVYAGASVLDEDLTIEENGQKIFLPSKKTGIAAIVVPFAKTTNGDIPQQPYAIMIYNGQQYQVKMRYLALHYQDFFYDFKSGIPATAFIFPKIEASASTGVNINPNGASIFLSPRLMRGMLAQVYLLDDPFKNFQNFKIVHSEADTIINDLNQQGMKLPEFAYYGGAAYPILGPIKIWEIKYTGKEKLQEKYIDTDPSKYLNWSL